MNFAIAVLRHSIEQPDLECLEMPRFFRNDKDPASMHPLLFWSYEDAQKTLHELNTRPYVSGKNELCRPDYYIISYVAADYLHSDRYGNNKNYSWDRCNCRKNHNQPCRDCIDCLRFMIHCDRQYIIAHSLNNNNVSPDTIKLILGVMG